jgi:hypothetical protein
MAGGEQVGVRFRTILDVLSSFIRYSPSASILGLS